MSCFYTFCAFTHKHFKQTSLPEPWDFREKWKSKVTLLTPPRLLPALCLTGWVCWLQSWEPLYSAASPLQTATSHTEKQENYTCSDIPLIYGFFFCNTTDRTFVDHLCDNILKQPSTEQSVAFKLNVPGRRCWGQTGWTVWRRPLQSGWSSSAHPRMSSGRNHSPDTTHMHKCDEAHLHDWAFYTTHNTRQTSSSVAQKHHAAVARGDACWVITLRLTTISSSSS